jgi:hypothetical protein
MQTRDPLLDTVILGPHTVISRADVLTNGVVVQNDLPVTAGQVTKDRGQWSRRTASATIGDSSSDTQQLLLPYGNEIRLWRGAVMPNGAAYLLCQGTFGIQDSEVDYAAGGVKITGLDRGRRIADARFPFARWVPPSSILHLLADLVREATPWANVSIDPALRDHDTAALTWDRDRQAACIDLAASLGGECYTEPFGDFVVAPVPDPNAKEVWTVSATGALVMPTRKLSRQGVYNSVVVKSTASGYGNVTSSRLPDNRTAIADDDPLSPTRRSGPFGEAVTYYDSPLVTSRAQADQAGLAILRNQLGLSRSVSFESAVHPALEAGDVVAVDYGDGRIERHILDRIAMPLGPGTMRCDTRTTSYQVVGGGH